MPPKDTVVDTLADKILRLNIELKAARTEKRETVKTANDEIKRIQAEIDDLIIQAEDEKA